MICQRGSSSVATSPPPFPCIHPSVLLLPPFASSRGGEKEREGDTHTHAHPSLRFYFSSATCTCLLLFQAILFSSPKVSQVWVTTVSRFRCLFCCFRSHSHPLDQIYLLSSSGSCKSSTVPLVDSPAPASSVGPALAPHCRRGPPSSLIFCYKFAISALLQTTKISGNSLALTPRETHNHPWQSPRAAKQEYTHVHLVSLPYRMLVRSRTHATVEKIPMQGWAHGSSQPCKSHATEKRNTASAAAERSRQRYLRQQYRLSLEKDILSLRKKLRQEVDTHKALERAFRRTLGVLPRFSPSLTPKVQELLAEVAVLEEEVINLEECIVSLRQGLYNEAVFLSASKQQKDSSHDLESMIAKEGTLHAKTSTQLRQPKTSTKTKRNCVIGKLLSPVLENKSEEGPVIDGITDSLEQHKSADNNICSEEKRNNWEDNGCVLQQSYTLLTTSMESPAVRRIILPSSDLNPGNETADREQENANRETDVLGKIEPKNADLSSVQAETPRKAQETLPKLFSSRVESGDVMEPNLLSEEMVLCLSRIFLRLTKQTAALDWETSSNISNSTLSSMWSCTSRKNASCNPSEEIELIDPYKICGDSTRGNVGPYQYYQEISTSSFDYSKIPRAAVYLKKLMNLLERLRTVDLRGLSHHQKLSFWINIYNVCMLHAFLEHGIPDSPHKVVALMGKAVINVGGHHLSALAIEHFILRLPCDFGNAELKSKERTMEGLMRSTYGLDWPEPLVSFALCCGSWSSPVLRIYTPQEVENELEVARNEYLEAAVGVTSTPPLRIVIPKLLHWYMRDFAKDAESLIDWICEQLLPTSELGKCVQQCRVGRHINISEIMEVMPYDFSFRYLFAVQLY